MRSPHIRSEFEGKTVKLLYHIRHESIVASVVLLRKLYGNRKISVIVRIVIAQHQDIYDIIHRWISEQLFRDPKVDIMSRLQRCPTTERTSDSPHNQKRNIRTYFASPNPRPHDLKSGCVSKVGRQMVCDEPECVAKSPCPGSSCDVGLLKCPKDWALGPQCHCNI